MNMNPQQIEYLSSLRRGYAAVYAEGDNRPKCVKLPLVQAFYEKNRGEVISEVKKKVYDIASGYDKIIHYHAGCAYCEQKCKYFEKISAYINEKVAVNKVLEKWASRGYVPKSLVAFLNSEIIKVLELQNDFERRCVLGYILAQNSDLNDGQRQKYIADYLRYINK